MGSNNKGTQSGDYTMYRRAIPAGLYRPTRTELSSALLKWTFVKVAAMNGAKTGS
jgi:hypothetical protein